MLEFRLHLGASAVNALGQRAGISLLPFTMKGFRSL